ncbi:hypothetical protein BU17DRAFT_67089 [Hysterangium stoloniferum]|nr:hypothetical protein BU17DRAFT_67089 [Hysterangium stoloniferum]
MCFGQEDISDGSVPNAIRCEPALSVLLVAFWFLGVKGVSLPPFTEMGWCMPSYNQDKMLDVTCNDSHESHSNRTVVKGNRRGHWSAVCFIPLGVPRKRTDREQA